MEEVERTSNIMLETSDGDTIYISPEPRRPGRPIKSDNETLSLEIQFFAAWQSSLEQYSEESLISMLLDYQKILEDKIKELKNLYEKLEYVSQDQQFRVKFEIKLLQEEKNTWELLYILFEDRILKPKKKSKQGI